jgi:hypothetical protein
MIRKTIFAAALTLLSASAMAAVSPEEAAQLGKTLTPVGAEKAGNKDGTIPEWTGGLTTLPAGFKPGDGKRPDPYAGDKPRLVITGSNADQYKDQLTAIAYALLKRYPTMRVDVYPTHRPVVFPKKILENTAKNAVQARSARGGLAFENAVPGFPFPIPKSGYEAMWNHLMRYQGVAVTAKFDAYNIDSSGTATLASTGVNRQEWPLFRADNIDKVVNGTDAFWLIRQDFNAPARRAGEAFLIFDYVNALEQVRKGWQYLPGQRRVKLAPDIAYDTPNPGVSGMLTYDDAFMFNGALDRYDFKLVGKREMIVPYDDYQAAYYAPSREALTKLNHFNPDLMRWELHRVWVVEGTLKPGKRHIYHKRTFYLDEDSWNALASDEYDARGQLYRGNFNAIAYSYDQQAITTALQVGYDLIGGTYCVQGATSAYWGIKYRDPYPAREWTPDALAGAGIR